MPQPVEPMSAAGRRSSTTRDAGAATYQRRQFELYQRIICGDGPAPTPSDGEAAADAAGTEELTFAEWRRERA